jgi:dTMP kinase
MIKGKYIVIEGPEGVGKTTQVSELAKRLQSAGLAVKTLREPDSQSDLTARAIRHLTQDPNYPINTITEVLLYNAARAQSLQVIKNSTEKGIYCIVDRSYLTTLAVQYYGRGDVPDYETINRIINFAVNGIEPDLTIVLDAPVQTLLERKQKINQGERFDNLDAEFLERVRAGYLWEANQRGFPVVVANGSKEEVTQRIWPIVVKTMAERTSLQDSTKTEIRRSSIPDTSTSIEPPLTTKASPQQYIDPELLVVKQDKGYAITERGKLLLKSYVTSLDSNVYAFYNNLSPVTVAAAMARLSRRGDDMRVTLLDEFANVTQAGRDADLLKRVITAYGDDSVQQLTGIHMVVEDASNLLTKKLEWGRLAAYLEQSTRYIYFDKKDEHNHYRYFTPRDLESTLKRKYVRSMDKIFDIYSDMVHKLTSYIEATSKVNKNERDAAFRSAVKAQACDAARSILPVCTTSTVGIFASAQALESMIMHLLADPMSEARETGQKLLNEARKIMPMFLERADKPERGGAFVAYKANNQKAMQLLADKTINKTIAPSQTESVALVDFWPRNELDIVADMLYEYSNLPLASIRDILAKWTFEQKTKVVTTYLGERLNRRHRPGRALEKVHYSWDLICDYGIFRDLQRHRMVDDLVWQKLNPRYGYEIPKLVDEAGLSEQFEQAFDISVKLYSELQAAGYENEAQYATLLGHRLRWKVTYNAREAYHLHELRTSPQGHPGYRKLVQAMHDKVSEVHPLLAAGMIFINKDEDPELNRLAAEKYTQFKMAKLAKQASDS